MRIHRVIVFAATAALTAAACTTGASPSPSGGAISSIGPGEGALTVLAWPGYAEEGTTPGFDWITPFETETGCQTTVQTFGTSDEAFAKFTADPEAIDVISASGDASNRLVAGGFTQPVNVDLVPSYAQVFPDLKDKPYNTFDGVHYGIPHGRGANLLMWRTDEVDPAPTSWAEMFDPDSPYAGKFSVYDAPIYIADAAVVLMATQPDLGITNPYALDDTQFQAAVDLLETQKPAVGEYWNNYANQIASFTSGDTVLGTTWQIIAGVLQASDPPVAVDAIKPDEGATGWSDTWMINSKTKSINCAYKFLNHITSTMVNAQIANFFGEAPGNSTSCELTPEQFTPEYSGFASMADLCEYFHAADTAYWTNIYYWTTPIAECLDGRTDVTCKTFDEWVTAWQQIRS
jgi:putative spermidine/putrescine transport system substrate-binding protein